MKGLGATDAEILDAACDEIAFANAEIATLRASRDAALARVAELEEAARKAAERFCKSGLHVIPGARGRCVKCQRTRNRDNQRNLTLSGGHAEKSRRYRKEHPEAVKRQREKIDPEKERARKTLRDAVRCGNVPKASACEDCGATTRLHGHHADYSKPLVVRWLCPPCHGKLHRQDALASPPPHDDAEQGAAVKAARVPPRAAPGPASGSTSSPPPHATDPVIDASRIIDAVFSCDEDTTLGGIKIDFRGERMYLQRAAEAWLERPTPKADPEPPPHDGPKEEA